MTLAVLPATLFPPESSTVTAGWVAQVAVLAPPLGWVVKPSLAAGPTVSVKGALVPLTKPEALADSV